MAAIKEHKMNFKVPYGKSEKVCDLDKNFIVERIFPNKIPPAQDQSLEVVKSLEEPVGGFDFSRFRNANSVAIAINDKTRPVPNHLLLPPLLAKLEAFGIEKNKIKFYIATGTHKPMKPSEFSAILPKSIISEYQVISHDISREEQLVFLGDTSRGTPVWVNRDFHESEVKVVIGDIEPHHFAGFSGGYKTAVIGLGGRTTINRNHSMLVRPESAIAVYENNPIRQDIEEAGKIISVDLAINAILNLDKEIITTISGDPLSVMKAGISLSRKFCQVSVQGKYDIVISSPGGHPKDINLYQAQKALSHASLITRDGGVVVIVAACPEGSGSAEYERFMHGKRNVPEVLESFFQMEFRVGPHKAYQFARELKRIRVVLVSEIEDLLVRQLLMVPEKSLNAAVQRAVELCGVQQPRIAVLPYATNTIPAIEPD